MNPSRPLFDQIAAGIIRVANGDGPLSIKLAKKINKAQFCTSDLIRRGVLPSHMEIFLEKLESDKKIAPRTRNSVRETIEQMLEEADQYDYQGGFIEDEESVVPESERSFA